MNDDEFLIRLKVVNKLTAASYLKATGLHFNKKLSEVAIAKTAESAKTYFVSSAKKLIEFLLSGVLQHRGLSPDKIKGLAAFDPYILFKRQTAVALRHFDALYLTFQLRSWVLVSNEAYCRDEYMALLDHLRTNYSSEFSLTSSSPDLIEFFMGLEFFRTHEHVCYRFKLCCLCLNSVSPQFPAVTMGKIDTSGLQYRMADVVLSCQSCLSKVPDSLAA